MRVTYSRERVLLCVRFRTFQVRNLAAAVSTLAEGLLYLLAFLFIISGAGLALLGVQTMTNNTGGAGEAAGSEERKPPMDGEDDT